MIKEGILWNRVIDPMSGRIVKEETALGSLLAAIILAAGIAAIIWLSAFL